MHEYNINVIYDENVKLNINEIFIKVLKKELTNYIKTTLKKSRSELESNCTYLSLQNKEGK